VVVVRRVSKAWWSFVVCGKTVVNVVAHLVVCGLGVDGRLVCGDAIRLDIGDHLLVLCVGLRRQGAFLVFSSSTIIPCLLQLLSTANRLVVHSSNLFS